ncbi:titin-like isoform X1 [Diorhabda carinulata]|uniref:titin-like isoform X1 n=2 Tax=Diorhabda carinulata TaxID=1163345 RepID=UPI0025A1CEF7|nr:titin-like isoform X1 [Diorhabda carinulata]
MANKDDHLTYYREFFENFAQTINPNDPLPVKLASYKLVNAEVVGGIIDWTTQYLSQKKCPSNLFSPLIKIIIEETRKVCKKQPVNCGFNPTDHAYEPLKLMQTVIAKTNEVCLRYLDNSMLCSLPSPDTGTPYCITSVYAIKNTRRRMEDRHVVIHDLNNMFNIQEVSPSSYYAVFDGHAGSHAAEYCSGHLHQFLAENKYFASNPKQALLDAFCKTDALFIDKCKVENFSSGATAVVALLRPKEKMLYVAWAGDSQALLVNKTRAFQIVDPHKPCREDERERIEKRGGCVMLWGTWRVNGQLAVSRAIGDPEYKPFVTAVPDIQEITLDNDDFLVIACDGLWDILSNEVVARTVYNLVTENPDDTSRISQRLVQIAKEQGSSDNITVIVVFLREPSKIAAEAYWENRNLNPATMEAGLDNSNNPFVMPNGANTDNMISQKSDGLLLNLTDNFKQNGTDLQTSDMFSNEKANGKRLASEFDDEDFGPETDVDGLDDALSPDPRETSSNKFLDAFSTSPNNNLLAEEGVYNPFMEHQEKAAMELENLRKREHREEFEEDEERMGREETPTPPADTVHDVGGLVENPADSESEDEWDYIKGEEANKENISPQPGKEVVHIPEEDDTMSQLNPNAAEFVPVSPTRSVPSPSCRMLINDQIVSQSPKKANDVDISVPNPKEFENEVKSRPSEIDANGHAESSDLNTDLMDNILNGKNIDEIPEFQPGSTPKKVFTSDEFHFGPNAAPFTPKCLDQSEALSTKAVYGDDTVATFDTSFNESIGQDLNILNKESDPMSMSFYADQGESNPFDLNKVQVLPDNLDDFLNKPDNEALNETISDLPDPLREKTNILNNDDAIQVTDLDKQSYDDEKELASPIESEKELLPTQETDFPKTSEPSHEKLIQELHCGNKTDDNPVVVPADVELIPITNPSPLPDATEFRDLPNKDTSELGDVSYHEATEVADLLGRDVTEVDNILDNSIIETSDILNKEVVNNDILNKEDTNIDSLKDSGKETLVSKEAEEVNDLLGTEDTEFLNKQATEVDDLLGNQLIDDGFNAPSNDGIQNACTEHESFPRDNSLIEEVSESVQPKLEEFARLEMINTESIEKHDLESQLSPSETEKYQLKEHVSTDDAPLVTPVPPPKSVCDPPLEFFSALEETMSTVCDVQNDNFKSELAEKLIESSINTKLEKIDLAVTPEPIPEHFKLEYPEEESKYSVCDLSESKSPISEDLLTPDFTKETLLEEAQERFEELCKPIESPQEDVTSSIKDDLSFHVQDLSSKSPLEDQVIEDSFVTEDNAVHNEHTEVVRDVEKETADKEEMSLASPKEDAAIDFKSRPYFRICPARPRKEVELPIDVGTETIALEYAEPAIVTPSDESRAEDQIAATDESELEVLIKTPPLDELVNEAECAVLLKETQLEEPVKETQLEEPVKETQLEEPVKETQLEESINKNQLEEAVKDSYAEKPVDQLQLKEPMEESKLQEAVKELQVEGPVKEPQSEEFQNSQLEEPIKELQQPEEQKDAENLKNEITAVGVAAVVAAGAAITAVVSATKVDDKKKSPSVSSIKKTTSKTTAAKSPAPISKTSPKLNASASKQTASKTNTSLKATTTKTGTTKSPTSTAKPSSRPNLTKPKTTLPAVSKTTTSKSAEKSSLTNGEVKTTARNNVGVKKTISESNGAKTTTSKPAIGTTLSKVSQSKLTSKPNPSTHTKTTIPPRTAPLASSKVSSANPKRPSTLMSKSQSGTTSPDKAANVTKTTLSKTSPKSTTNALPKTKPTTNVTLTKPRIPPTKTVTKTLPDTEKQNKESANKIMASRSASSAQSSRTTTTNAKSTLSSTRKVESKVSSTRTTVSKTTTTTMKSTTAKKPSEIIKGPVKTKTTKIEKPKENGVFEVVTEEITIVNNTNAVINALEQEPELIKDNSPVDNKILIETTQIVETKAD